MAAEGYAPGLTVPVPSGGHFRKETGIIGISYAHFELLTIMDDE